VIRPFEPADAAGVAALFRRIAPEWVVSDRGLLHWVENEPERARLACWVALADGEVAGWAQARVRWEFASGAAEVFVGVDSPYRRHGLGGRLYELAESHLSTAARIYAEAAADEDARRFLLLHGFSEGRSERISVLDPRSVDLSLLSRLEAVKGGEGFRVLPLAGVTDRAAELHRLFEAVDADTPHSEPLVPITLEEWRAQILEQPDLDHEASAVILAADGRLVAISWLQVDREGARAMVEMTGTLREFRRRGLARLAKLATVRWAAEHGITAMYTGNDIENRAMLALNDELGFEPRIVHQDFVKELR
jgi:GNAT superfamily N-acetyltransferase